MRFILIMALAFCAPAAADCTHNAMECTADSPWKINSFSQRAAETITAIAASRLMAVTRLQEHLITVAQAQDVQTRADHARDLWQEARIVCHATAAGDCRTRAGRAKAFALLTSAQRAIP
jgi:hypothetical protein